MQLEILRHLSDLLGGQLRVGGRGGHRYPSMLLGVQQLEQALLRHHDAVGRVDRRQGARQARRRRLYRSNRSSVDLHISQQKNIYKTLELQINRVIITINVKKKKFNAKKKKNSIKNKNYKNFNFVFN